LNSRFWRFITFGTNREKTEVRRPKKEGERGREGEGEKNNQ
jgi:hypothetical protein